MREIRITPTAQLIVLLAVLTAVAAAVVAQVPELRRYLKIESM
jgi:uncharacterized protein DUF6893